MSAANLNELAERLYGILGHPDFLAMKGLANEVPIFIQTYPIAKEDALWQLVTSLTARLSQAGIEVCCVDLLSLVLDELEEQGLLHELVAQEADFSKVELLETLQNYSDPRAYLIPRLIAKIGEQTAKLTLVTGSGRVFPFLRTHTILESLQPAMLRHPVVLFFPGEYEQDLHGGSQLRLFGAFPSPTITNPYYRATNLDHFRL